MERQVVLITGASSGIGMETARLLAQRGFIVYGAARRVERMEELKKSGVRLLAMDVTDDSSMERGIGEILSAEKRIDVLVNNAGYGSYGALEDVPISEARRQFDVNVFGLARLTQLVLPQMRRQGAGRIINISSIGGRISEPGGAWYHATKFAVEGLSDCLRMELRQFNIDVVVIQPGGIKTEWNTISRENLMKTSGSSAYRDMAQKQVNLLARADRMASSPVVIAKVITRAILAHRPRTRYAAGMGAKPILFFRKILPDRVFDSIMLGMLRFF